MHEKNIYAEGPQSIVQKPPPKKQLSGWVFRLNANYTTALHLQCARYL